jgi:hypothetical protein
MAKEIINVGQAANDGTGDPLRNAFEKVNSNFTELYDTADTQDLDFTGDSGTGSVELDSQTLNLVGTNGVETTANGQTITIDTSSLDTRLTTAEADIDTNTASITTEETARIAADTTLQTNIDAEATTRGSADTTLQTNIDSEAATRLANDNTLQSNIDAEAATRLANDNTLQGNIDTEASTRSSADTALQGQIDSNDTDIATNAANIATNVTNIATNVTNIASNDTDISNLQSSKQNISEKNQANGYAPLDSGAKIPIANLPDSVVGQVEYQGTWDASIDDPTLPSASTVKGHYYVVSVGGTYETITYAIGDWIISNGVAWEKIDNTDAVTTVFGRLGAIVANEGDYSSYYPLIADLTAAEADITALQNDKYDKTGGTITGNATITGNLIVDTNTLYVDSAANRVGIRTSTPNADLDILNGVTGASLKLSATSTAYWQIQRDSITGNLNISDDALGNVMSFNQLTGNVTVSALAVSGDITVGNDIYVTNGNFLKLQRSSGGLYLDVLGNESGTDDIRLLSSGNFKFVNGSLSELMRIDSSGNVIVKQGQLQIQSGGNVAETNVIKIGTHPSGTFGSQISVSTFYNSYLSTDLRFSTTNSSGIITERMRITSEGDVLVGGHTSVIGDAKLSSRSEDFDNRALELSTTYDGASNKRMIEFYDGNNDSCGYDYINPSTNTLGRVSSSDYRLKEDEKDFDGLSIIKNTPVYDFKWKKSESRSYGVFAHELQQHYPEAVFGEKDGEENQGVDYAKLIPVLMKAIQQQQEEIETLKSQINN